MVLSNVRPNDPLTAELTRLTVRLPRSSLSRFHTFIISYYQQVHKYFKSIDYYSALKIKKYSLVEENVVLRTGAQ